jgi:hypothetical protein
LHWFWKELDFAKQHRIPILPLRIDGADVPTILSEILQDDLREGFEAGLERVICSMTSNPVLPFLKRDERADLEISVEVAQSSGPSGGGKFADMTVQLGAERSHLAESLFLTMLGQWDIEQPNCYTTTEAVCIADGLVAEVRAASGSKVVMPLSLEVESGGSADFRFRLFTRHNLGNELGKYLYLLGAELVFDGFRSMNLGIVLVDLHGLLVLGHTQGYGSQGEYEGA